MNQAFKRSAADFMKFVPFCSSNSTSLIVNSSIADTTGAGSSMYGNIIDLLEHTGYETLIAVVGARAYTASSNVTSSQEPILTGHFVTDTSSAFGGSTTLGSTFTISLKPSSAQSSEEGVLVASVNLNDAGCYRYIRFIYTAEVSSGDNEGLWLAPMYILSGRDDAPATHNVQVGGAVTT